MNKHTIGRELGDSFRIEKNYAPTKLGTLMGTGICIVMIVLAGAAIWYGGKALFAGISYAEARRATAECEKWADEAKVYPGYFLVRWQKMQCDTYGVAVDAPVNDYSSK